MKRHRLAEWIFFKSAPTICCLTHFRSNDAHRLKVKEWKKIFYANRNEKRDGVVIPI